MTPYDRRARTEIDNWRDEKDGALAKVLDAAGAPVEWVYEKAIPNSVDKTVKRAVLGFLEMIQDGSQWTYPDSDIVREARRVGLEVSDYRELRNCDLEKLDKVARRYFTSNKLIAALEGAGCGLGGLALVAADIPLLFGVGFRAVQQIGSSYGFDMEDPNMRPIVMSVFNVGASASSTAKAAALADMRVAATAFSKNWTYKKVAKRTQTGVVTKLLKERTKHLPKDIANNVTKRKLSQAIPLIGAGIGAGFNYWFLSNATQGAYMVFRDLHLQQKYDHSGKLSTEVEL
jgi:hypothetical protein